MDFYGTNIKIEHFYNYLYSKPTDELEEIRKKFMFCLNFSSRYKDRIHMYHAHDELYDFEKELQFRRAIEKNRVFKKLICESYLGIILHKTNLEDYKNILIGLCNFFEIQSGKSEVICPCKDFIDLDSEEWILTKEEYIKFLNIYLHSSTNAGIYLITPALSSIIEFEKTNLKENENVKCLKKKTNVAYGDLK